MKIQRYAWDVDAGKLMKHSHGGLVKWFDVEKLLASKSPNTANAEIACSLEASLNLIESDDKIKHIQAYERVVQAIRQLRVSQDSYTKGRHGNS